MSNFIARIISDGRITIPETIREVLHLKDGDLVEVEVRGKVTQTVEVTPSTSEVSD